jgi:hypothetical protein
MPSELSVTVKDSEKRMTKRHLIYEAYTADVSDPTVAECIRETVREFGSEPDDVRVKINLEAK